MDLQLLAKDLAVAGISLIALVIGLTAFVKKLGVSGRAIEITGFVIGALLGGGYQFYVHGAPTGFNDWFTLIVFALAFALGAPGFYDVAFRDKE